MQRRKHLAASNAPLIPTHIVSSGSDPSQRRSDHPEGQQRGMGTKLVASPGAMVPQQAWAQWQRARLPLCLASGGGSASPRSARAGWGWVSQVGEPCEGAPSCSETCLHRLAARSEKIARVSVNNLLGAPLARTVAESHLYDSAGPLAEQQSAACKLHAGETGFLPSSCWQLKRRRRAECSSSPTIIATCRAARCGDT